MDGMTTVHFQGVLLLVESVASSNNDSSRQGDFLRDERRAFSSRANY